MMDGMRVDQFANPSSELTLTHAFIAPTPSRQSRTASSVLHPLLAASLSRTACLEPTPPVSNWLLPGSCVDGGLAWWWSSFSSPKRYCLSNQEGSPVINQFKKDPVHSDVNST